MLWTIARITSTTRGRDVNIGSLHMSTEKKHHTLVGGTALRCVDRRGLKNRVITP